VLRFSELRRVIPGISQKMLIQQLRDLEKEGVVNRKVYPEVPPKVEYMLTEDGVALRPALRALKSWAVSRKTRSSDKKKRSADSV
jgi:DNA-binding HxlR family transcriptional regulator